MHGVAEDASGNIAAGGTVGRPSSLDAPISRVPLSAPVLSMASLRPGDQLGHYRIEELVARSGMASIYRATDMRNGRPVAI